MSNVKEQEDINEMLHEGEEVILIAHPEWKWTSPNVLGLLIFTILWLGFIAAFTMMMRLDEDVTFEVFFTTPFWLIGIGLIVGMFWNRRRMQHTRYLITTQRAVILRPNAFNFRTRVISFALAKNMVKKVIEHKNGYGDIVLGYRDYEVNGRPAAEGFISVPEVQRVHGLLCEQIAATCGELPPTAPPAAPAKTNTPAVSTVRTRRAPWWIGLFFIIPGMLELGVGLMLYHEEQNMQDYGVRTTAVVVDADNGEEAPAPIVCFSDAKGTEHTVQTRYGSSDYQGLGKGDKVEIIYLPDDPQAVDIATEDFFFFYGALMAMGAAFIVIGLSLCIALSRKKQTK